jgi:DNA polymerase I-like protein with 3'-5' exonuclease and polymerase domains
MVEDNSISAEDLKVNKKKESKPKKARDLESSFIEHINNLNLEELKKPWMATKVFRLIDTVEELERWVEDLLNDPSRHFADITGTKLPVVAVDTETMGLDTRVVNGKTKTELAGICLSADGIEGLYIPVGHRAVVPGCHYGNVSLDQIRPILQKLFDNALLVFYNAKFDREILRLLGGFTFREYPGFEDLQVDNYLIDPKAKVDDKSSGGLQIGGLKVFTKTQLGFEQIELDELCKVKAQIWNEDLQKNTLRIVLAPFTWVPTDYALWYAASDAICTWLGWDKIHAQAQSMIAVHRVDHQLVDTLSWVERQRVLVDTKKHKEMVLFHQEKVDKLATKLSELADLGVEFNPGSNPQLREVLFKKRGFRPIEVSEKTGDPSASYAVLVELQKQHPDDEFLALLMLYREYAALHPAHLHFDPEDHTARFYFKQNVVAGGRLAAAGGEWEKDGGSELNPQAIKRVEGNWWVKGKPIELTDEDFPQFNEADLDPSCFDQDKKKAPNIKGNHIATYFGKQYCMVPKCSHHTAKSVKIDANEILNLRALFRAADGWTMFSIDYSNIEMRVAANVSKEPAFIREFMEGSGDFHSLTAKALFPEFSDPETHKARKKQLRSLAKIINFALLYGGTAYTIHENLNKEGFNVSFDEAAALVEKYWEAVPTFAAWCDTKRQTARTKLLCRTPTGRVITFGSAMKFFGIKEPLPEHKNYFFEYKRAKKEEANFLKMEMNEEAQAAGDRALALYKNKETGVKNYIEYNRFLGKAERVSINIPLQGTAGDMMRSSMNKIRLWVQSDPFLEYVFRLHMTVHDEIDFSIRNEFVPYVLPRINRIMKLRGLHRDKGWVVPIETDCEYGPSWDVQYHLTGDDAHTASGYMDIPGLESYLPAEFDPNLPTRLFSSLSSGRIEKVKEWMKTNLHNRVHSLVDKVIDERSIRIVLQLHEFWTLDEDEEGALHEPLSAFSMRTGVEQVESLIGGLESYHASIRSQDVPPIKSEPIIPVVPFVAYQNPEDERENPLAPTLEEESVFYEPPKRKDPEPVTKKETETPPPPPQQVKEEIKSVLDTKREKGLTLPQLLPLKESQLKQFVEKLGIGNNSVSFIYRGMAMTVPNVASLSVPEEYVER